jgi:hypothetical protein
VHGKIIQAIDACPPPRLRARGTRIRAPDPGLDTPLPAP